MNSHLYRRSSTLTIWNCLSKKIVCSGEFEKFTKLRITQKIIGYWENLSLNKVRPNIPMHKKILGTVDIKTMNIMNIAFNRKDVILGVGNPLLDIIASVDDKLLVKYDLRPNNAILARESDNALFKEIEEKYHPEYFVGGAAQNTMRIAQWIIGGVNNCAMAGCVGKDEHAEILTEKVTSDGVDCRYQYAPDGRTGICNVLLSKGGTCRSLVTSLGAAFQLSSNHFKNQENQDLLSRTKFIYITSFIYSVSTETILYLAEFATKNNRTFCLNLAAPFLCRQFASEMAKTMPYVDILLGNDEEASEYARCHNFDATEIKQIALKMANLPKENKSRKRLVIITQGSEEIIVATDDAITVFPVKRLTDVVDTNGAGDAFVGGFLSQLYLGMSYKEGIKCGIWAAAQIIQQFGTNPPKHLKYKQ